MREDEGRIDADFWFSCTDARLLVHIPSHKKEGTNEGRRRKEKMKSKANKQTEQRSSYLVWVTTVVLSEDASDPVEPKETAPLQSLKGLMSL